MSIRFALLLSLIPSVAFGQDFTNYAVNLKWCIQDPSNGVMSVTYRGFQACLAEGNSACVVRVFENCQHHNRNYNNIRNNALLCEATLPGWSLNMARYYRAGGF